MSNFGASINKSNDGANPRSVRRLSVKHRLLIANRDVQWRELYQRFFAELGYEVETAADGLDCLAKLRHAAPAMLVLDLELPWGGGDGVLAWLHEESSAPKIPVLLMGSAAALPDMTEFNEPHIVDYLPKPAGLTRLLDSIRSAFARTERGEPQNVNRVPRYSEFFTSSND